MFKSIKKWAHRVVTFIKKLVKKVIGHFAEPVVRPQPERQPESKSSTTRTASTTVAPVDTEDEVLVEEQHTTFTATILKLVTQWIESVPSKPPIPPVNNFTTY